MIVLFAMLLADPANVSLVCRGGGSANKARSANGWALDNRGNSASGTVTTVRGEGFEDQTDVVIENGTGRIRLPRMMLPRLRGGKDGWFELDDLETSATAYSGTAKVNLINHPKVRIDRRTGVISIDGKAGHYVGQCEDVQADAPVKF